MTITFTLNNMQWHDQDKLAANCQTVWTSSLQKEAKSGNAHVVCGRQTLKRKQKRY